MDLIIMLIGPALFWAAYHYYKDRHNPEPFHVLILMFALGIGAGFLANLSFLLLAEKGLTADVDQLALNNRLQLLFYSVGVIGGVEELAKFLPFYLVAVRHAHFDERFDGIIYASFIALGFASFENFYYLQTLDGTQALGRAIASPLVHVMFSSIWGYAVGRSMLAGRGLWTATVLGLSGGILFHGLFDFFTFSVDAWYRIGPPVIVAIIWMWRMRVFTHAKPDSRSG